MANKYFDGTVTNKNVTEAIDQELIVKVQEAKKVVSEKMDQLHVSEALEYIFEVLRRCNKYIDETTPWALAKDDTKKGRLQTVLYNLLESIRVCGMLLSPFLPETSLKIQQQLNNQEESREFLSTNIYKVGEPSPLFQRIDKK